MNTWPHAQMAIHPKASPDHCPYTCPVMVVPQHAMYASTVDNYVLDEATLFCISKCTQNHLHVGLHQFPRGLNHGVTSSSRSWSASDGETFLSDPLHSGSASPIQIRAGYYGPRPIGPSGLPSPKLRQIGQAPVSAPSITFLPLLRQHGSPPYMSHNNSCPRRAARSIRLAPSTA